MIRERLGPPYQADILEFFAVECAEDEDEHKKAAEASVCLNMLDALWGGASGHFFLELHALIERIVEREVKGED